MDRSFVLPLICLIFLSSCETTQVATEGKFRRTTQAQPGEGYLLFSIVGHGYHEKLDGEIYDGMSGFRYNSYLFQYRSVETFPRLEEIGIGSVSGLYEEADFAIYGGFGVIACQAIPAGEYEIYGYTLLQSDLPTDRTWHATLSEPITFTVKEGVITYLGSIRAENKFREAEGNVYVPDGVTFSVSEQFYRDNTAGFIKWPYLMSVPHEFQVLSPREAGLLNAVAHESGGSFF
ncbi:hypothetical protein [Pelagicoccus sp. SDUM812002]|uniref:hypothetical protein n=1 Tax=Pelagicoccus sp. SDUM812002 TaxID=3041266 RepID=UPI00280F6151|nr:hypothetical protein [Pelagicoccus sp. SDUM812002]MDQ8186148.1 hypothetical protein [Pelagicoccus sp. SDUM812002]